MSDVVNEWLSVEAAALRLGISGRSIARRIQNGQLESRVDANGRRSVLVCLPAATPAAESAAPASSEPTMQPAQARELAQQAMTVVIRTHEETALAARTQVMAAARSAHRAWAAVAILLIGSTVTVGVVTHNLTAASAIVHQAEDRVDRANHLASDLSMERDQLRQELVEAKVQGAQAQGQLSAMTAAYSAKPPTTAPSNPLQRVAAVLFGD